MRKPAIGAVIRYCGHEATFIGDIFVVGNVNVVRANGPLDKRGILTRDPVDYKNASHHLSDFPTAGFWRPDLGVFVVPETQVTEVLDHER